MGNGIKTIYPCRLKKGFNSNFRVGSRIGQETPEETRRMNRPKRLKYDYKDKDNSPNSVNGKNYKLNHEKSDK